MWTVVLHLSRTRSKKFLPPYLAILRRRGSLRRLRRRHRAVPIVLRRRMTLLLTVLRRKRNQAVRLKFYGQVQTKNGPLVPSHGGPLDAESLRIEDSSQTLEAALLENSP